MDLGDRDRLRNLRDGSGNWISYRKAIDEDLLEDPPS